MPDEPTQSKTSLLNAALQSYLDAKKANPAPPAEPPSLNVIPQLLRPAEQAGTGFLGERWKDVAGDILFRECLQHTWATDTFRLFASELKKHAKFKSKTRIDYKGYKKVAKAMLADQLKRYKKTGGLGVEDVVEAGRGGAPVMLPEYFLLFHASMTADGSIPINALYNFFQTKAMMYHARIEFLAAAEGRNYLTEDDLNDHFTKLVGMRAFQDASELLTEELQPYYVTGITRKIFFYLDLTKRQRVKIDALMVSPLLSELIAMQLGYPISDNSWFSAGHQISHQRQFMFLARGKDHLESEDLQLHHYCTLFRERVFEALGICKMTWHNYLDMMLAMEDLGAEASLPFLFRVLDLTQAGRITPISVHRFLVDVIATGNAQKDEWGAQRDDTIGSNTLEANKESIVTELFDIVSPRVPLTITMSDLRRCKERCKFFSILFHVDGFDTYEAIEANPGEVDPTHHTPPKPFSL